MNLKKVPLVLLMFVSTINMVWTQEKIVYKQIDTVSLYLDYYPAQYKTNDQAVSAILFFFGGGWNGGTINQFKPHAEYLAQRGMACFLVDYRVTTRHQSTPFESLKDAKSAMRFVRKNAKKWGIDPSKLVAAGGSAGGHLAIANATAGIYNDPKDNLSISCVPNALVLFIPVFDNGPGGYGYERIGEAYTSFSPLHNIRRGIPPAIVFLGTEDKLVPVVTAEYFKMVMEKVGSRSDLFIYEGQGHGFFNYDHFEYYRKTLVATDEFLQSLDFLRKDPLVEIK